MQSHPRNLKFKRKHQQYDPCFQTVSLFLMAMLERIQVLINHIQGNHYGFVKNLKYHAMNISP